MLVPIPIAILIGLAAPDFYTAFNRSRQKQTMAKKRDAAQRFEKGHAIPAMRDAWGTPMRVHVDGKHYSIVSAGLDGSFEMRNPEAQVAGFRRDIILLDGIFVQMPDGI